MTKIEDIVYSAIDLGLRDELFDTVKKFEQKYSGFYPLSEVYEIVFNEILSKNNDKLINLV
jgi:hypothetical protein